MLNDAILARAAYERTCVKDVKLRSDGLQELETSAGFGCMLGPIEYTIKPGDTVEFWRRNWAFILAYRINGGPLITTRFYDQLRSE